MWSVLHSMAVFRNLRTATSLNVQHCLISPARILHSAAIQLLFLPLGSQLALPWANMPLMRAVYIPLLALTFIPGATLTMDAGTHVSYDALSLFVFAATWSSILVRIFPADHATRACTCALHYRWLLPDNCQGGISAWRSQACCRAGMARINLTSVVVQLLLFVWSVFGHLGWISYRPHWRRTLLRVLTQGSLQALTIPLISSLIAPWTAHAGKNWLGSTTTVRISQSAMTCLFVVRYPTAHS